MPIQLINPPGLPQPQTNSQVVVATGTRQVIVAGQVPSDAGGNLVGPGDLAAQTEQALCNVATPLAAAGATLVGVAAPAFPGQLIEIEATAVLP